MNHKVSILYRHSNFFASVEEFIHTYDLSDYELTIYNCTEQDIEYENSIKTDKKIETIIKSIYHENNTENCIILDTCIKYEDLDIEDIMTHSKSYCLINYKDFKIPIILSKTAYINNSDILIDYNTEYSERVVCDGIIDELFYNNFFSKLNVGHLIFASILNKDIDNLNDFRLITEKSKIYFKLFKLRHMVDVPDNLIMEILVNNMTDTHIIFILIDEILRHNPHNTDIVNLIVEHFNRYALNTPFILSNKYDIYVICEYIIKYFLNEPLFIMSDIPNWVLTGHNNEIYKYYPCINSSKEKITLPLSLAENSILKDATTVEVRENQIDITNKGFIRRRDQILIVKSITPLGFSVLNSDKLIICYTNSLQYKEYALKGLFINFNNYLIGLFEEKNKSYKLVILDSHNLKLVHTSRNFILSDTSNAISLYKDTGGLYIISNTNDEIFKCKIDFDTLIVNILYNKNIVSTSPFSFNIELKNSIGLKIIDFDLTNKHMHKNYTFYNLPTDQRYYINATFNPQHKLLEIDDKLVYINEFIFLSNDVAPDVEKKADIYFHESAKNTDFYTKCVEMQISTSTLYQNCRYFIIAQEVFETLNCLEVSNIIKSRCLIISMIDEALLKAGKIKGDYTTNETLMKLFLINIVQNSSYVQFILDKIIHSNEYSRRKDFMDTDILNIKREHCIYDCILDNINKETVIDIDLNSKDRLVLKIIKAQILRDVTFEIYKNILDITKFIIYNNFSIQIGFIDIDNNFIEENNYKNILQILFKINWLGKIDFNVSINSSKTYNLYVLKNRDNIGRLSFVKDTMLYLIEDNLLLKI